MAIRLDVGCGSTKIDGFIGMDHLSLPGVDIVHDLNEIPWPFEDNSVKKIVFCHSLSHLENISSIMIECSRLLVPGGILEILAPHYSSDNYKTDPTHKMSLGVRSMNYFILNTDFGYTYIPEKNLFHMISSEISFRECSTSWRKSAKFNPFKYLGIEKLVNLTSRLYEKFISNLLPASEVYFVLKKPK